MKYKVNFEGYIIVEADSKEEALNNAESLYDYYTEYEFTSAEEYDGEDD